MFGGFKPFAKQKVDAPVVDLACDSSGEMVAAITVSIVEVDIAHDHEIIGFKGYLAKPFKTAELIDTLLAVGSQHGE